MNECLRISPKFVPAEKICICRKKNCFALKGSVEVVQATMSCFLCRSHCGRPMGDVPKTQAERTIYSFGFLRVWEPPWNPPGEAGKCPWGEGFTGYSPGPGTPMTRSQISGRQWMDGWMERSGVKEIP
ncbi:hypothetical protein XENORESO_019848 [Xenotaenia resolanae]|uniref:Uncharacterized protein n=1 Tax=Xenotaenia resolanae TaxID=208358 RepID=A0ABV0WHA6_9TELE